MTSPIACRMDALDTGERARRTEALSLLRARLSKQWQTEEGLAFRWVQGEVLPLVAELVSLERRCCPFIEFRIEVHAEGGAIELHLGGREGVRDFLVATFGAGQG
jgi:hypothetical protein